MKKFCHLHLHNEYSILDGFGTAERYAARAKELGFKYLALTNHGNVDGLIQWQEECRKQGIKSILGVEAYIVRDAKVKEKGAKSGHITLLVKNQKGFRNLNKLMTYANLEGFYYRPRIDYGTLIKHNKGLVVLSGCAGSLISIDKKGLVKLSDAIEDFWIELMPHLTDEQKSLNIDAMKLVKRKDFRFVATNDCHYITEDDAKAQEMLLAIQTRADWNDKERFKFNLKGLHLRTRKEMEAAFKKQKVLSGSQIQEALDNTIKVAKSCADFQIKESKVSLPPVEKGLNEDKELDKLCRKGYKKLFGHDIEKNLQYLKRFKEEIKLISSKGFARYFLIIKDLLNWCDKNGIMYGPGRGSVGGSLVAYLTGITKVDPIIYKLLFSRFINEDRIDYPDIDIDFEDIRVDEVRAYLEEKYGAEKVVGISTALRMKAKGAIKDVSRTFGIHIQEVNNLSKALSKIFKRDADITIEEVEKLKEKRHVDESVNEVKVFMKQHPQVMPLARKLEGQVRAHGQHAAALVLSPKDLTNGRKGHLVRRRNNLLINWDMDDVEKIGLLKVDILALNTLSILNDTRKQVKANRGIDIVFEDIDLNDRKLFKMMNDGDTEGLFQVNTYFMTKIVKEIRIEKLSHLYAAIALGRPGPYDSGMAENYIERKNGASWTKKIAALEKITKDTFGVIVYQEQIMQALRALSGMTYSESDKVRKVLAKKRDVKELKASKKKFFDGCKKLKTLSKRKAEELWAEVENHAKYSFNRSHSVEYAIMAMWTAYCKKYHPKEFISAVLTYDEKEATKKAFVQLARKEGLEIVLPKVGKSESHRWVIDNNKLYVPFIEVKNIGDKGAVTIASGSRGKATNRKAKGFYKKEEFEVEKDKGKKETKVENIARKIGAYDLEAKPKPDIQDYFKFNIFPDFKDTYPRLWDFYDGDIFPDDESDALKCRMYNSLIIRNKNFRDNKVVKCRQCGLRAECEKPVPSSKGKTNAAIICEAPGPDEDKAGEGLVGKSGDKMWKELAKYKLKRKQFHVTNVNKCYPSLTRNPKKDHIIACSPWLNKELEEIECKLALACGNNALFYFTGQHAGITNMSGKVLWLEHKKMWVVFSVHPSAVLHNAKVNKPKFEKAIKTFAKIYKYQRRKRK